MNLAAVDISPVCPWKNKTEWLSVYHQVLSKDDKDWDTALHTLTRWVNLRTSVPAHVAASIPVLRARCLLHSGSGGPQQLSACMTPALLVNWAVRIAVIEFVNIFVKGIEAECSTKATQATLYQLALEAGLPQDLIPLRNSLVHSTDVASTSFLQTQVVDCMWHFLKTKYWDVEYLVLRRRQELLGHAEKRCISTSTTTDALRQHVAAVLQAVNTNAPKKIGLSSAPILFKNLKEALLECLEYVQVFTSEGKMKDRETRTRDVIRVLVEDLLLAPAFVNFLRKNEESCTCGCLLHVDRVPLKKLLVFILTHPPSTDLLCRAPGYVEAQCRREYYRKGVPLGNHLFSILLDNLKPKNGARAAACEWLWLLLSCCAPEAFPSFASCLKCPHHNLFLSPAQLAEVRAPRSGCCLRGKAVLPLHWSPILLQMLSTGDTELLKEAHRLLPACLASAELQTTTCERPALLRECQRLKMLTRKLEDGGGMSTEDYHWLFPTERGEVLEYRAAQGDHLALRSAELLRRQQAFFNGYEEIKPCVPLGYSAPPAADELQLTPAADKVQLTPEADEVQLTPPAGEVQLTPAAGEVQLTPAADKDRLKSATSDDKTDCDSSMHPAVVLVPVSSASFSSESPSSDKIQTDFDNLKFSVNSLSFNDSQNSSELNTSISSASPNFKQKKFISSDVKQNLSSPSTGSKVSRKSSECQLSSTKKQRLSPAKCSSELTTKPLNKGCDLKLQRNEDQSFLCLPKASKKRRIK